MQLTEDEMAMQRAFEQDMFYVYVLRSEDLGMYIGYTNDLSRRFKEHISGKSPYTRRSTRWKVMYFEAHTNMLDAQRRERYLKTSSGSQSLRRIMKEALHEQRV